MSYHHVNCGVLRHRLFFKSQTLWVHNFLKKDFNPICYLFFKFLPQVFHVLAFFLLFNRIFFLFIIIIPFVASTRASQFIYFFQKKGKISFEKRKLWKLFIIQVTESKVIALFVWIHKKLFEAIQTRKGAHT